MATVLVVTVLRGERLKGKDYFSKSDSYVKLKLADTTKKTKVIMNDSNPEWNQTFELAVKDPETDSLEIAVYDWDKDTRHDLMGTQVVSLKQLKPNVLEPFTLDLLKNYIKKDRRKEKNRGKISLELRLEYRQRPLADSADGEPDAGDEEVNEEDNVAEETPLTDSAEAIPLVKGEAEEVPTSDEELDEEETHEGETIDEGAQSPETGEAIVVEDFEDGKPGAGDEDVHEKEHVAEARADETPLTNSAEAIPLVNGKDVEAPTSDETLDKGDKHEDETIDEDAVVVADFEDGKPGAGDEEVHEEEKVAEETPLTDSAGAIPLVEGKNVEAPTSDEELVKRETADEEAQSPGTGEAIDLENVAGEVSVPLRTHPAMLSHSWLVDIASILITFPFSMVLMCSESIAKLFSGPRK